MNFNKALAANRKAKAQWKDLTPLARMDFVYWIESAKKGETHDRRITKACSILAEGKRRPCCYSIVPMNLYKKLTATPKAKAAWKNLTPIERREFVYRIDSAKDSEAREVRIEKTCTMLAAGKRRP
ncbi:MAG: YdeI/OmpD-associated family protein [Candidatus Doudnabacteria bacterium]